MDVQALRLFIVVGAAALLIGCATSPPNQSQKPAPSPPIVAQPAPRSLPPAPAAEQAKPNTLPPANANPNPKPTTSKEMIQKGHILVTKEEYKRTFEDVHHLINELNQIIASRDYHAWLHFLTPKYVQTYSDPKKLEELSDQPMLKRYHLHLKTLNDYFLDVVVPSRANARLDDVDFVSKTQVKAITIIDGQRYILYDLRLVNGTWKVGVS